MKSTRFYLLRIGKPSLASLIDNAIGTVEKKEYCSVYNREKTK